MAREHLWLRGEFLSTANEQSTLVMISDNLTGDTFIRAHIQCWAENYLPIPLAFPPYRPMMWTVGLYKGPWAGFADGSIVQPTTPPYEPLHVERTNWELEEHTLESTKYERWLSPRSALKIDVKAQRKFIHDDDGIYLRGQLLDVAGVLNPVSMRILGAFQAFFYLA